MKNVHSITKSHHVSVEDLKAWRKETEVVFASQSGRVNKRLSCTLDGTYIVRKDGVQVYSSTIADHAVDQYNMI